VVHRRGLGDHGNKLVPCVVEALRGKAIRQIGAGGSHSLAANFPFQSTALCCAVLRCAALCCAAPPLRALVASLKLLCCVCVVLRCAVLYCVLLCGAVRRCSDD
jgi:hypothetical protein